MMFQSQLFLYLYCHFWARYFIILSICIDDVTLMNLRNKDNYLNKNEEPMAAITTTTRYSDRY